MKTLGATTSAKKLWLRDSEKKQHKAIIMVEVEQR